MEAKLNCTIGEKEFLNLEEVCAWLSVGTSTIYDWEKRGLKCLKIGKIKRYSKKHLAEFIEAFEQ